MEPVTHLLTGACLARAGFNRRTAYAVLAMTLAAEAPDLDVLSGLGGPVAEFDHHRGILHSLVAAPLMAVGITAFIYAIHRLRSGRGPRPDPTTNLSPDRPNPPAVPIRWAWLWFGALVADLSHLLLDYTNNYGLRPFLPFSGRWYAWSIVYIFDPILFAMLAGALLMPALLGLVDSELTRRRNPFRGRAWALAALVGVGLLYALRNAEQAHAVAVVQANPPTPPGVRMLRVAAEPYPADPFLWHILIDTPDKYQTATVHSRTDVIDTDAFEDTVYKPPVTPAAAAARRSYLGRVYTGWSSWPVIEDLGNVPAPGQPPMPPGFRTVRFRDLRFTWAAVPSSLSERAVDALTGYVAVDPAGRTELTLMGGREQK